MDYSPKKYTLENLSPAAKSVSAETKETTKTEHAEEGKKKKGLNIWVIFIILAVIVGLILYFTHPSIVLSRNTQTGELYVDWGKLVIWSIVIAIIGVLLLWLLKGALGYDMKY